MPKLYKYSDVQKPLRGSESELSLLISKRQNTNYFTYQETPVQHKTSSKYDPENPNRNKLGTFDGVFIPTTLNVLSILMFLRFGFIIGQMGILGTLFILIISYGINLLTTLSISAISTNGTVRGGGAYYMISRCLGPEFGGSIGLIFFLGQILNSGMNSVGMIEPLFYNFALPDGIHTPSVIGIFPRGYWYEFSYSSFILLLCLGVSLVGSTTISRAGNVLFFLLLIAIISIPFSALVVEPFERNGIVYTGPSWTTFYGNLFPQLTQGAAGSVLDGKETFNNLFGIFFPATAGIFAGAGMSSELRKPSTSIPKGTLWGLLLTFSFYMFVIISLGTTVPRESLHKDVQIIQSVSVAQILIFIGEFSTSLFSIIVGIVGAAYVLEAISRDRIIPGLSIFEKNPHYALLFSWFLTQLVLFSDVNRIATFITMTFLMTFVVMNLACLLLEISSAPNFRPSFKWFNRYTAFTGSLFCIIATLIVDTISASFVLLSLLSLFVLIHYTCPPKPWGYVSQSLIYHQVRKYLLRLRQDNVKYWRPQVLLLVDNPRTSWNLIRFCNHLKKGGLYILGHVTVSNNFQNQFNELRKQTRAWVKIRDMANIKAFVHIGTGPTLPWGVRNVYLGSGLGGMKPNITVLGFFDLGAYYESTKKSTYRASANELSRVESYSPLKKRMLIANHIPDCEGSLPTDECKNEMKIKVQQWVQIIEDLSLMQSTIAVAHGFKSLVLPSKNDHCEIRYVDLYPIQMSAKMVNESSSEAIVTTNFDTYTLILQLGAILVTVPDWKRNQKLRVIVFVESENERADEKKRITNLLSILRIEAETLVLALDQFRVYNTIVKGDSAHFDHVNDVLKDDDWWNELVEARKVHKVSHVLKVSNRERVSVPESATMSSGYNISRLQRLGIPLTMNTNIPVPDQPSLFYDSDEEGISDFLDLSTSLLSLDHEEIAKSPRRALKTVKSKSKFRDDRSVRSLLPVFSSDAIPKTRIIEDSTGEHPSLIPIVDKADDPNSRRRDIRSTLSSCQTNDCVSEEIVEVKFNNIPSRAQHLIMNDMMMQVSGKSHLIFSTLPIPALGTHNNKDASLQYVEDLDLWLEGLPPTMLVNSQTMTVTTAL